MKTKHNVPELPGIDYCIFSDGSGYKDYFGGFCAHILDIKTGDVVAVLGGQNETTTFRQEFKAVLEALSFIYQKRKFEKKLNIKIYSDAQALVGVLTGENELSPHLSDLWQWFTFFESEYVILPEYVTRENDFPLFQKSDLHASAMRVVVKDYIENSTINLE